MQPRHSPVTAAAHPSGGQHGGYPFRRGRSRYPSGGPLPERWPATRAVARCPNRSPQPEPLPAGPGANCDNRRVSIVPGPGRGGLITHPEKVYFAERGETKGDLAEHYARVAEPLMRAMGGRPVLLQRFPDGAGGPSFFQKRVPKNVPGWLQTTIVSTPNGTTSQALIAADLDHVLWAVNLGCLGFHVWPYLAADPEHADELRIDLDPSPGVEFSQIRQAARELEQLLAETGTCMSMPGSSRAGTPTRSAAPPSPSPASWSGAGRT